MIKAKERKNSVAATAKIRVIKKGETSKLQGPIFVKMHSKKELARQMVATVMNWVSDFETRKIEETRLAMERFQHM
jgi:hypothetical protein